MVHPLRGPDAVPGLEELETLFQVRQPEAELRARPGTETAAVFALFVEREGEPALVLTRRSQNVAHHKGEVAFPGGVAEPEDGGLLDTARRETVEELGVRLADIEPWGALSPVTTSTGFQILPFTGRLMNRDGVSPCADEVDEVFDMPLSTLLDPGCVRDISVLEGDELNHRRAYACGGRVVWGATAAILTEVLQIISGGAPPEQA